MNISTLIVVALVLLAVVFAVRSLVKSHKSGGHCSGCSSSGSCPSCSVSADKMVADMTKAVAKEKNR